MSNENKQAVGEALRKALMVEIKGQQLYSHAAMQTENPDAKAMFQMLSNDEDEHVRILQVQYKKLMDGGKLDLSDIHPVDVDNDSEEVITESFKKSIKGGKFEMAVIGIGCDLEAKAIAFYKENAETTEDADLKKLFTWLTEWEIGHLDQLRELEKLYQDAYWADQGFSPM